MPRKAECDAAPSVYRNGFFAAHARLERGLIFWAASVDIALLITPDGPPDVDHDGIPVQQHRLLTRIT
jgi:hypothetical protein